MLDIIKTPFYLKHPVFDEEDFTHYSTLLFDEWDGYVERHLNLADYAVNLVVEKGSIKGLGTIATTVGALYIAIANYGSFITGVQTIGQQADYVTKALFEQAKNRFSGQTIQGNSKQSRGEIYYLNNLFERVQAGQITPEGAMSELQDRWAHEVADSPEFLEELAKSLAEAPRHPEQLFIPYDFFEHDEEIETPGPPPKSNRPRAPEAPIPQHYRIEIFRPSKREDKKIKLTKL